MEQNEKESFFVDNFGHYLLNFISDRVKIAGQSNSDKWSLLFHKIEEWIDVDRDLRRTEYL